jgi:hypothetical protein
MTRIEKWDFALRKFLHERKSLPFVWGQNDCALFAADAVLALTGFDPAAQWRGYQSEEEAKALIRAVGSMEALFTQGMGKPPHQNWRMAARGDVALINLKGTLSGAVVDTTGRFLMAVQLSGGLKPVPLEWAKKIWSY